MNQGDTAIAARVEQVMRDKSLTFRERQIVVLLLNGQSYQVCAKTLAISVETVKFHTQNATRKLGVKGRNELFSAFFGKALKLPNE